MKVVLFFVLALSCQGIAGESDQTFCPVITANCSQSSQTNENTWNLLKGVDENEITPLTSSASIVKRGATNTEEILWPRSSDVLTGQIVVFIPYEIDPAFNQDFNGISGVNMVRRAIATFNMHSCVEFVPRVAEIDYVRFVVDCGCRSPVGRQGGRQEIILDLCCWKLGIILHEMMHTVGFYHEHSRPDRDQNVNIDLSDVANHLHHNFQQRGNVNSLGSPYDFDSIMHYGSLDFVQPQFGQEPTPAITMKPNNARIFSQRNGLSDQDIFQLNALYECISAVEPPPNPTPENQPDTCPNITIFVPTPPPTITPTTPAPPSTPPACVDVIGLCSGLADIGWCTLPSKLSYMEINCCATCSLSPTLAPTTTVATTTTTTTTAEPACVDNNQQCPNWAADDLCNSIWVVYMEENCRNSCGFC